jgi:hypothetical protein
MRQEQPAEAPTTTGAVIPSQERTYFDSDAFFAEVSRRLFPERSISSTVPSKKRKTPKRRERNGTSRREGIIYPNDNGENLIEYIVLCKQSTIISY